MNRCIWCLRRDQKPSREHIVPEVLGCPGDWILSNGEVCEPCNNRLGVLDRVLADEFDLLRLHAGQPGKRGKQPRITSRTNLRGERRSYGVDIQVNLGKRNFHHPYYGLVNPPTGKARDVEGDFTIDGSLARVRLRVQVGATVDFSRAIHKIAYSWVAKLAGAQITWRKHFEPVRDFVLRGTGTRHVISYASQTSEYRHLAAKVHLMQDGNACVEFTICGMPLLVDLSADQRVLKETARHMKEARGTDGWSILPPPKPGDSMHEQTDKPRR